MQIDHRRGRNANLGLNEGTTHVVRGERGYFPLVIEKTCLPKRWVARTPSVKGIHAVVLGRYEQNVVLPFSWNLHARHKQRLRENYSVNLQCPQLAKLLGIDILRSQNGLAERCARTRVVVLRGRDLGLNDGSRKDGCRKKEREQNTKQDRLFHLGLQAEIL